MPGPIPAHGWVIEDGCLKNKGSGGPRQGAGGGDLVTIEKFDDFDFKFDWRISPGGNSGVKYFVHEGKTGKSGVGYEYQLLDDTKNEDARPMQSSTVRPAPCMPTDRAQRRQAPRASRWANGINRKSSCAATMLSIG